MNSFVKTVLAAAGAAALAFAIGVTPAAAFSPLITVDENGNGTLGFVPPTPMPGVLAPDPGPGGLGSVLTYNLLGPPSLTAGDVLLMDGGNFLDVVRFNPANPTTGYAASLLFYSDNVDGLDAVGDTPSPPGAFYANLLRVQEGGNEINNGAFYHPSVGQPGYVPGFDVAYNLISDGTGVPEPAAWAVMLLGFGLVGAQLRRHRETAAA